jgi:hypothetical protein
LLAYQHLTELGALAPVKALSVYPAFLLQQVWSARPARWLLVCCAALSLGLLVWVGVSIPSRSQVPLVFHPDGSPGDLVPAPRLLLLPILNFFFLLVGVLLGLYFFRHEENRPVSYLLWASNALTAFLFLLAVFFILQAG